MTCRLRWCVDMETRCRIPIWQKFGRMQWHVILQPHVTLQDAATWWIHCHDSRATCHTAGCSYLTKSMSWSCHIAGCKNSIRHIENRFSPYFIFFLFLMQFRLWRAAAWHADFEALPEQNSCQYHVTRIPTYTITSNCSSLIGTPNCVPWRKCLGCSCLCHYYSRSYI